MAAKKLEPERAGGGFLCLADGDTGMPIVVVICGEVPPDKCVKYFVFAQEKAMRLAGNRQHVASWQSRDESKARYGGAIRYGEFILSFSGFSEAMDEAMMIELGSLLLLYPNTMAKPIVKITGNEMYPKLLLKIYGPAPY